MVSTYQYLDEEKKWEFFTLKDLEPRWIQFFPGRFWLRIQIELWRLRDTKKITEMIKLTNALNLELMNASMQTSRPDLGSLVGSEFDF